MSIEVQCPCGGTATIHTTNVHHPVFSDGDTLGHNACSKCGKRVDASIVVIRNENGRSKYSSDL